MAALGWLLNLGFAGGSGSVAPPPAPPQTSGGGGPRPRYTHYTPVDETPRERRPDTEALKKLLRRVAETDSEAAKRDLERRARNAADAVGMIHDIQVSIRELEREIGTSARELDITHQWAQKMIERVDDERIILMLLLEDI